MAQLSELDSDKALWLTLAQSWVRLAEHVARNDAGEDLHTDEEVGELEKIDELENDNVLDFPAVDR